MKKAQIEMVGLLVIVLILAISFIIAVTFLIKPKSTNILDQSKNIVANSVLNALFSSDYDLLASENKKIREKVIECINLNNCEIEVKPKIERLLNKSLDNKKYYLIIKSDSTEIIRIQSSNLCNENTINKISSYNYVINPTTPLISSKLIICP